MIQYVTITGADNSTDITKLKELSKEYPFVEWGILASIKWEGAVRYPTTTWINDLVSASEGMNLSLHLCGKYALDFFQGSKVIPSAVLDGFNRIQLNMNLERASINSYGFLGAFFNLAKSLDQQIIFQLNNSTKEAFKAIQEHRDYDQVKDKIVPFYDSSGGRGLTNNALPTLPVIGNYTGYSGGLSNSSYELINEVVDKNSTPDNFIWFDTESKMRTKDGRELDFEEIRKFLDYFKVAHNI